MRYIAALLIILLPFSASLKAEQLEFRKSETEDQIEFYYRWLDSFDQPQTLRFSLPKEQVLQLNNKQTLYKSDIAQRHVYIELMKQARQVDPREARIRLRQMRDQIQISVSSRSEKALQKWQNTMATKQVEAFDAYLHDNYYIRYVSPLHEEAVKPDHMRYLMESREVLLPVAQALYEKLERGTDTRAYVNLLISWVQSIPYNELENRLESNGAGYLSPIDVILQNQGDCDSKTTLTASLMRALLPQLSMTMLFLPDHALLGANLSHRSDERTLELNGLQYLLIEPTGPAHLRIGEVAPSTGQSLATGLYTYEKVP